MMLFLAVDEVRKTQNPKSNCILLPAVPKNFISWWLMLKAKGPTVFITATK
jgi:hypothetical protein